jgi:tRNA threonylcarbamoyladenosine biosynthesis protein TsaE
VLRLVTILTKSSAETAGLGETIGRLLGPGDVVAITGVLGSGKSVLARGIMAGLGVASNMPSPSFVIVAAYEGKWTVNHIDLYRLDDAAEALDLGIEDLLYSEGVCVIEWADRLGSALPASRLDISIQLRESLEERLVTLLPSGEDLARRLVPLVSRWRDDEDTGH